jgi:hypothetical protein
MTDDPGRVDVSADDVLALARTYAVRILDLELQVARLLGERSDLRDANVLLAQRIRQLEEGTEVPPDPHPEVNWPPAEWQSGPPAQALHNGAEAPAAL